MIFCVLLSFPRLVLKETRGSSIWDMCYEFATMLLTEVTFLTLFKSTANQGYSSGRDWKPLDELGSRLLVGKSWLPSWYAKLDEVAVSSSR